MIKRKLLTRSGAFTLLLIGATNVLLAQGGSSTIRANIRPGGGDGKCTFEVEVDQAAEVQLRGDTGYLRTLSGSPATWRRLDCNGPIPANANNLRFSGVDGRGSQNMVSSSSGAVTIRIDDPKNGREGYTGDVTWSGGSNYGGNSNGGGNWNNNGNNGGGWNNNNNGNNGGGWNNGGWNHNGTGGWNGNGRQISVGDALNICQNEVASESGADRDSVRVNADNNNNNRGSYVINFQIRSRGNRGGNASGSCRVSRSGQIEDIRH